MHSHVTRKTFILILTGCPDRLKSTDFRALWDVQSALAKLAAEALGSIREELHLDNVVIY